jgi:acetyl-CoA/propionyl-CoA carboxylase biotin carboxyl carrier protein
MSGRRVPVLAPHDGSLSYQHVEDGARVEEGEPICAIELMKMQSDILAPCAGTVRHLADLGEVIAQDQPIAEIITE